MIAASAFCGDSTGERPAPTVGKDGSSLLNLRSGPGTEFNVKLKLDPGEKLKVDAEYQGWKRVTTTLDISGWVRDKYITETCEKTRASSDDPPKPKPEPKPELSTGAHAAQQRHANPLRADYLSDHPEVQRAHLDHMKNFPHGSLPPVEFDRPFDGTVKVIIAVTQQTLRALCGIDYPASGCAKLRKHMTPLSAQLLSRADAGGPIGTPNKSAGTKSAIVTGGHGTMLVRAI